MPNPPETGMRDTDLLDSWPIMWCKNGTHVLEPVFKQDGSIDQTYFDEIEPHGWNVPVWCSHCRTGETVLRSSLEMMSKLPDKVIDIRALMQDWMPISTERSTLIDPTELNPELQEKFFMIAALWEDLIESGLDPVRLQATILAFRK